MRAYHFVPADHGVENIKLRHLKIARLDDLNDPFEVRAVALGDRTRRRAFEKFVEAFSKDRGLLCFSRDWKNPVQWSHYADRHRGICLGFDVPENMTTAVTYRSHRYPAAELDDLGAIEGPAAQQKFIQMMNTKFQHWQYENEVRLFASLTAPDPRGLYFAEFSPDLVLAEVIVGHRCSLSRRALEGHLGDLRAVVSLKKARLAFNTYEVVEQQNKAHW